MCIYMCVCVKSQNNNSFVGGSSVGNFHFSFFLYYLSYHPKITFIIRKEIINSKIRKIASNKGHLLERREVISDSNEGNNLGKDKCTMSILVTFQLCYYGSLTFLSLFFCKVSLGRKFKKEDNTFL